jgi:hypothetical protein
MVPKKVVAIGHSHLGALAAAYANPGLRGERSFELSSYQFLRSDRAHIVHEDGKGWRYHPEIEKEVLALLDTVKPDAVTILLQGEQAVLAGLVPSVRPYDFFFPSEIGYVPDPTCEIIPFSIVFEVCKDRFRLIADFLDLIGKSLPDNCFALGPPPLVGDRDFILNTKYRHGEIASHIEQYGLPSTVWRLRVWEVHMMALRSIYRERGIRFLEPPMTSCSAEGCLNAAFRGDVFHANAAYGQLLLAQIDEAVRFRIM